MTLSDKAVPYSVGRRMEVGARMLPVTVVYAVLLLVVSVTLTVLGPHTRELVVSQMSTNLHNLAHGHWHTLVGSAFVNEGGEVYFWLPGLVSLLALGELAWRSKGLLVTFAVGHVGATLIVAEGLVAAIKTGWLPVSVARSVPLYAGGKRIGAGAIGSFDDRVALRLTEAF